jgi:ubiquitin-protein ligase
MSKQPEKKKLSSGNSAKGHFDQKYKPGNVNYRIQKELKEFVKNPPPNCEVSVGKNIRVWIVTITGAEGTVYAGEKYKLRVAFPDEYPAKPPSVYFLKPTPRHAHCYTNGDICLSLLGKDWKPNLTVSSLALSILSMLSSAKQKSLPLDNAQHADSPPGKAQDHFVYHDDSC